jgi:hypothetical protein
MIKTAFIISLIDNIPLIFIIDIILIMLIILQVCVDLGITDHLRQEKNLIIVATIDGLGDKFKPELCDAWLAYISETYLDGPVSEADSMGEGLLEIDD